MRHVAESARVILVPNLLKSMGGDKGICGMVVVKRKEKRGWGKGKKLGKGGCDCD